MSNIAKATVTLIGVLAAVACNRGNKSVHDAAPPPPSSIISPIPSGAVAAALNPGNLTPYSGPTGSVEGDVFVLGPESPDTPNLQLKDCEGARDAFAKVFRAGDQVGVVDGKPKRPLADAVIGITEYQGYIPSREETQLFLIGAKCEIPTRTVALTFGEHLDVATVGDKLFGPTLSGVPNAAIMMTPPKQNGEPVHVFPPKPGFFKMTDTKFRPFLDVDVYALRNPLHAVTDRAGHFRIDGVPVGSVKLSARSAAIARISAAPPANDAGGPRKIGETSETVVIRDGAVTHAELYLEYVPMQTNSAEHKEHIIP